jgi:hypothetical protein
MAVDVERSTACAGCDERVVLGDESSYGEWHRTPLGLAHFWTHRSRECVLEARRRLEAAARGPIGGPVALGPVKGARHVG